MCEQKESEKLPGEADEAGTGEPLKSAEKALPALQRRQGLCMDLWRGGDAAKKAACNVPPPLGGLGTDSESRP